MVEFNIEDAFQKSGHGLYNYAVLLICCTINVATTIDLVCFGIVIPAVMCDLQLSIAESGLMASAPFAGILFALPWGYYADRQGRRKTLLLSVAFGFLFAVASSFAPNWQSLIALKFIGCSFSSAGTTLTMTYLGELTGDKHRNQFMFIMNSFNLSCEIITFGLAYLILPMDLDIFIPWLSIRFRPWRAYLFVMAMLLGLSFLMMFFLHESPKFLANIGKSENALNVLRSIHRVNRGTKECYAVDSLEQITQDKFKGSFWTSVIEQTAPIFKPPLLWNTLQLLYLFVICYSTLNAFYTWFPLFVNLVFASISSEERHDNTFCAMITANTSMPEVIKNGTCTGELSPYTIYSGICVSFSFLLLNLAVSVVAKWRKLVLIGTYIISAASGVLVNHISQPLMAIVLFSSLQITGIGIGNIATYFVDMYPTSYRGLVTNLGMMLARFSSFGAVNLFAAVIMDHCTVIFYSWSLFLMTGAAVALFLPSDRKKT